MQIRDRILSLERVPASQLRENPQNWRQHPRVQQGALDAVLREVGVAGALLAYRSERNGGALTLIDGHLRRSVEAVAAWPVLVLDVSDAEADLLLASVDPIGAMATASTEALTSLLARLSPAEDDVQSLLEQIARQQGVALAALTGAMRGGDPDQTDVPEEPRAPVCRTGDVWALGRHRVVCGDSTHEGTLQGLLGGRSVACVWTDPPYGVSYQGKTSKKLTIQNDGELGLSSLLDAAFQTLAPHLDSGTPLYVAHPAGPIASMFYAAFQRAGFHLHQSLVWVKDTMVLGHSDYHYQHEPVLFGEAGGDDRAPYEDGHEMVLYGWLGKKRRWFAGRKEKSVFFADKPAASRVHPTMKPVALIEPMIRNSTQAGDLVFDGFLGSGSTLLACERTQRVCYGVELSPGYVDVIVGRWEALTGLKAECVGAL